MAGDALSKRFDERRRSVSTATVGGWQVYVNGDDEFGRTVMGSARVPADARVVGGRGAGGIAIHQLR
jgi:hypothetical protein